MCMYMNIFLLNFYNFYFSWFRREDVRDLRVQLKKKSNDRIDNWKGAILNAETFI